jgi:hypothetical protein
LLAERMPAELHLHLGVGAYAVWLATPLLWVGSLGMGDTRRTARAQDLTDSGS